MKECPVCKAGSFDDAEVCYGCLHRFGSGQGMQVTSRNPVSEPPSGAAVSFDGRHMAPEVMEVPALAVARLAACEVDKPDVEEATGPQAAPGQLVSVPSQGGEIVLRIEVCDARGLAARTDPAERDGGVGKARACERFRQGSSRGARVEVRCSGVSNGAESAHGPRSRDRGSRSRHASSPRHAQETQRDLCAVGS